MTNTRTQSEASWPSGFPWGAVLAGLLVWAVDSFALGPGGLWDLLDGRLGRENPMERGVVSDRLELARVAEESVEGEPLVAVMGSSRANAGIHLNVMAREAPGIATMSMAHAGMTPYEIRGAMDELLPLQPDLVVLLLSEFDTHRPLRLLPQTAPGSLDALWELSREVGFPFVWEHRTTFLQVGLASVLNAYRFRAVFGAAGLEVYRRFPVPGRPRGQGAGQIPFLLEGGAPLPMNVPQELAKLADIYPHLSLRARSAGLTQCRSITRGPHAAVQMELIAHAVAAVRASGGQVLLVEGPLAPATLGTYDPSIRQEFLELVDAMCRDEGVSFLSLEESGPFPQELFADLTHLQKQGAVQLSTAVGRRVMTLLELPGD